jgi:hypothetical protein
MISKGKKAMQDLAQLTISITPERQKSREWRTLD